MRFLISVILLICLLSRPFSADSDEYFSSTKPVAQNSYNFQGYFTNHSSQSSEYFQTQSNPGRLSTMETASADYFQESGFKQQEYFESFTLPEGGTRLR